MTTQRTQRATVSMPIPEPYPHAAAILARNTGGRAAGVHTGTVEFDASGLDLEQCDAYAREIAADLLGAGFRLRCLSARTHHGTDVVTAHYTATTGDTK